MRGAHWSEIDIAKKVWTVPAERMKAKREHRVPLSTQAIALLKSLPSFKAGGLLFPGSKPATKLSDMALTSLMRRMQVDAVPHGMRASFRNWTAEETAYPNEVESLSQP